MLQCETVDHGGGGCGVTLAALHCAGAVGAARGAVDICRHQGAADVEDKLRLGGGNVPHVVVVLVPPQLGQAEHLIPSAGLAQDLITS